VTLTRLPYREVTVDITLNGAGTRVRTLDGRPASPLVRADSTGHHTLEITLGS
jgi:hypothetical protein